MSAAHDEARRLAKAMRSEADERDKRKGSGRYRGIVVSVDPLQVDVPAIDSSLDETEVTIWGVLAAHIDDTDDLAVGDNLLLHELDEDDFAAVDIIRKAD